MKHLIRKLYEVNGMTMTDIALELKISREEVEEALKGDW